MTLLWFRRPDITIHPAGHMTWELRANSSTGLHWLRMELGTQGNGIVIATHDEALDLCFKAIRDGLIVCSDPG